MGEDIKIKNQVNEYKVQSFISDLRECIKKNI